MEGVGAEGGVGGTTSDDLICILGSEFEYFVQHRSPFKQGVALVMLTKVGSEAPERRIRTDERAEVVVVLTSDCYR